MTFDRSLFRVAALGSAFIASLTFAIPAVADSGQLLNPTRCGTRLANCTNLPPSGTERLRDKPLPSHELPNRRLGGAPGTSQDSPLPSEQLRRSRDAPSSTGLDKGSTGISLPPLRKHINH